MSVFPASRINRAMLPAAAMDSMMTYVFLYYAAGHVARAAGSDPGDLVPTVMPPNSTATIPQGFKAQVWSVMVRPPAFYPRLHAIYVFRFVVAVFQSPSRCPPPPSPPPPLPISSPAQAMLHKEAIVCLPQSSAELPEEDGAEMLKPGEERAVGSLSPQEDPSDTALKLQAECLDGLDPSDYAWVKVPIGSIIKWQGAPQSVGRHESFAIRHFWPSLTATHWCPPRRIHRVSGPVCRRHHCGDARERWRRRQGAWRDNSRHSAGCNAVRVRDSQGIYAQRPAVACHT